MAKNPRLIDLSDKVFGRWLVVHQAGNAPGGGALWHCMCVCGNEGSVLGSDLRAGKSVSCGCYRHDCKPGLTHGGSGTRLHRIWKNMTARCLRATNPQFADYGGRGIAICDDWLSFVGFRDWALANGYADNLSIERVDVNGSYTPENCTWATQLTQSRNRRFVKRAPDGTPWVAIAAANGISAQLYNGRKHEGWTPEEAATWPKVVRKAPERLRDSKGRYN